MAEISCLARAASGLSIKVLQPAQISLQSSARVSVRASAEKSTPETNENTASTGESGILLPRRSAIALPAVAALASVLVAGRADALIPSTAVAGRVPGLSEPDENGWRTYRRPTSKSGGHGVGWSEFTPYSFKVPETWEETPVSIADLGGTEIDLRFQSSQQGRLLVVVAPVLRFADGLGSDVKIEQVGTPERVISAFGPEITGENVDGKVNDMVVVQYDGRTYYQYELDPHVLIVATAAGNRLYLASVVASGRQWKKYSSNLKDILTSFRVG